MESCLCWERRWRFWSCVVICCNGDLVWGFLCEWGGVRCREVCGDGSSLFLFFPSCTPIFVGLLQNVPLPFIRDCITIYVGLQNDSAWSPPRSSLFTQPHPHVSWDYFMGLRSPLSGTTKQVHLEYPRPGSNRRPFRCKRNVLTAELRRLRLCQVPRPTWILHQVQDLGAKFKKCHFSPLFSALYDQREKPEREKNNFLKVLW